MQEQKESDLIAQLVDAYTRFLIEGKRVQIPYSMVLQPGEIYDKTRVTRTTRFANVAAKGTPEQIRQILYREAAKDNFDLKTATVAQIHQFMLQKGIGIDCSGFIYHILDQYLRQTRNIPLGFVIRRFPGIKGFLERLLFSYHRVRRCSAETLTSDLNTIPIDTVEKARPGDMIRLTDPHWPGKHIAIIVEIKGDTLLYAHASEWTEVIGPHVAMIKILYPDKGLAKQQWLEKKHDGSPYGPYIFHPEKGDSIRRLKILV